MYNWLLCFWFCCHYDWLFWQFLINFSILCYGLMIYHGMFFDVFYLLFVQFCFDFNVRCSWLLLYVLIPLIWYVCDVYTVIFFASVFIVNCYCLREHCSCCVFVLRSASHFVSFYACILFSRFFLWFCVFSQNVLIFYLHVVVFWQFICIFVV